MRRRDSAGVTLIEFMIVLVLIGVLVMLALPAYTTWIANTRIRTAAEGIYYGMQLARTEAVRRNTNAQILLGATGSTWRVTVGLACPPTCEVVQERSAEEGTMNTRVAVTPGAARMITFDSLGRVAANVDATAAITEVKVDINPATLPSPGFEQRELCVMVLPAGIIRMCDPDPGLLPDDTRRCMPAVPAGCT